MAIYKGESQVTFRQEDLQYELDRKQEVLVSGDNIKTINHESLLGSGNIELEEIDPIFQEWKNGTSITAGFETSANHGIAIGDQAKSYGENGVAIGNGTLAMAVNSVAIGYGTAANEQGDIAIGNGVEARGVENPVIAIGDRAFSSGEGNISIGMNSNADYYHSVAIGSRATANGSRSVALGSESSTNHGEMDVVSVGNPNYRRRIIHVEAGLDTYDAVTVGQIATINGQSITEGGNIEIGGEETETDPVFTAWKNGNVLVAGDGAVQGQGEQNVILGPLAEGPSGTEGGVVCVGYGAKAAGQAACALGYSAAATAGSSVAIGHGSTNTVPETISFGTESTPRRLRNVAVGIDDSDAATVGQLAHAIGSVEDNFLPLTGGDMSGGITFHVASAIHMKNDTRRFIQRIDGNYFFFLVTDENDPSGEWNDDRPLYFDVAQKNLVTGYQFIVNNSRGITTPGPVECANAVNLNQAATLAQLNSAIDNMATSLAAAQLQTIETTLSTATAVELGLTPTTVVAVFWNGLKLNSSSFTITGSTLTLANTNIESAIGDDIHIQYYNF